MVVCRVESGDFQIREVFLEHLLGSVQHEVSSCSFADSTQNHNVVDRVELHVLCQSIAKVHTNCLVDLSCLGFLGRVFHCFSDLFQTLCMVLMLDGAHILVGVLHFRSQFDACLWGEFRCTTLPQIHVRKASVRTLRPRVCWGPRVHVQTNVAQLIDPTHEVSILVRIPSSLAAAHGDAQDVALFDLLVGSQSGDLHR